MSIEIALRMKVAEAIGGLDFYVRSMGLYMRDRQEISAPEIAEFRSGLLDIRQNLQSAIALEGVSHDNQG